MVAMEPDWNQLHTPPVPLSWPCPTNPQQLEESHWITAACDPLPRQPLAADINVGDTGPNQHERPDASLGDTSIAKGWSALAQGAGEKWHGHGGKVAE